MYHINTLKHSLSIEQIKLNVTHEIQRHLTNQLLYSPFKPMIGKITTYEEIQMKKLKQLLNIGYLVADAALAFGVFVMLGYLIVEFIVKLI
jgi:hypothetical protein